MRERYLVAERDWVTIIEPKSEGDWSDDSPYVRRCKIPFGWLYQVGEENYDGDIRWGQAVFVPEGATEN